MLENGAVYIKPPLLVSREVAMKRPGRSTESAKVQSSRRATRFSSVVRASRRYVMRGTLSVIPSVSSVRRSSFAAWNTWGSSWHGT